MFFGFNRRILSASLKAIISFGITLSKKISEGVRRPPAEGLHFMKKSLLVNLSVTWSQRIRTSG